MCDCGLVIVCCGRAYYLQDWSAAFRGPGACMCDRGLVVACLFITWLVPIKLGLASIHVTGPGAPCVCEF